MFHRCYLVLPPCVFDETIEQPGGCVPFFPHPGSGQIFAKFLDKVFKHLYLKHLKNSNTEMSVGATTTGTGFVPGVIFKN